MFERLEALIGKYNIEKIQTKRILLIGIGGVGGYTFEALVRSGFMHITIIDGDTINESNLNRQIITNSHNIGTVKVNEAKKRGLDINPDCKINAINIFLTKENILEYLDDYDYIIDACDDINIKFLLIKYAKDHNIKIITCLGTGKKLDASKLIITKLNKTFNDPLAKKLRHLLRENNINLDIPVVFSSEEAIDTKNIIGSAVFVPASAGLLLANYVFLDVINN